jgi:hypothetical protein
VGPQGGWNGTIPLFALGAVALAAVDSPAGANLNPLFVFASTWDQVTNQMTLGQARSAYVKSWKDSELNPTGLNPGQITKAWKEDSGFWVE